MLLLASTLQVYVEAPFDVSLLITTLLMIFYDCLNSNCLRRYELSAPDCVPHTGGPSSAKTGCGPIKFSPTQGLSRVVVRLRLLLSGDVELNPGPLDQGNLQ